MMRNQDPQLREDVLEFLRERAFPTWDFFDATARRRLLRDFPGQQIANNVAQRVRDAGPLMPHVQAPFMFRPAYQITVTAVRPPQPPEHGLLGRLRRFDNSIEARDTGITVMVLTISAFGPFASALWLWPAGGLDPPLDTRTLEEAVRGILREEHLAVLTREEGLIRVHGMKGTPYSHEGRIPSVNDCLFDATSFLMRGRGVRRYRPEEPGDLWPRMVDDSA